MSDFSGMLRDIAEDICAGRIKWWNDPVWIKTLKDSANRLNLLEAALDAARDVLAARDQIEHQEQLVRDGNLHPSARTTAHIVSWMNAEMRLRTAIHAADQSSAVGEKDGGGECR